MHSGSAAGFLLDLTFGWDGLPVGGACELDAARCLVGMKADVRPPTVLKCIRPATHNQTRVSQSMAQTASRGGRDDERSIVLTKWRVDGARGLVGPAVVKKPRGREARAVRVIITRLAANPHQGGVDRVALLRRERVGRYRGEHPSLVEHFVSDPIANAAHYASL